jgi:hypothetical protein
MPEPNSPLKRGLAPGAMLIWRYNGAVLERVLFWSYIAEDGCCGATILWLNHHGIKAAVQIKPHPVGRMGIIYMYFLAREEGVGAGEGGQRISVVSV